MRLIDADAIKYTARFTDYADGRMTSDAIVTEDEIDEMPTIDAVPREDYEATIYAREQIAYDRGLTDGRKEQLIVRCKDCKWWGLSSHNTLGIHICKKYNGVRFDSDYCSRAERREE